jgi:hypothetical protein
MAWSRIAGGVVATAQRSVVAEVVGRHLRMRCKGHLCTDSCEE